MVKEFDNLYESYILLNNFTILLHHTFISVEKLKVKKFSDKFKLLYFLGNLV